jgi:gamma-glutamyl-gamma-aminobutyrate hydrolase PuuD
MDDYRSAVERAGGIVEELAPGTSDISTVLERLDGLVLTGGADVDPSLYGEARHESFEPAEPDRDFFEIALVTKALGADLPVLAICRGLQVLNVAEGGTLIQDIPSAVAGTVRHDLTQSKTLIAHDVRVAPGTKLAQALAGKLEGSTLAVNSRHHQSVKQPAPGFVVSAVADDGVVEALERPGSRYCVAVQWHPENFWRTGEFQPLFEALVAEARAPARASSGDPEATKRNEHPNHDEHAERDRG